MFEMLKDKFLESSKVCFDLIETELSKKHCKPYNLSEGIKITITKLISEIRRRWQASHRKKDSFLKNNNKWLDVKVTLTNANHKYPESTVTSSSASSSAGSKPTSTGRPASSFGESSERSKRRKTEDIREKYSHEELGFAVQMKLRQKGKLDAAKVVKDVIAGSPSKATRYRQSLDSKSETTLSSDEALALLVENHLSKGQYSAIRSVIREKDCKLFPRYSDVLNAKKNVTQTCPKLL